MAMKHLKHKGQFTKKNAATVGRLGGLKTKKRKGKKYFVELAHKRWKKI